MFGPVTRPGAVVLPTLAMLAVPAIASMIYAGVALLPPLFGLLVAIGGGYAPAFTVTAGLLSAASLYYLTSR